MKKAQGIRGGPIVDGYVLPSSIPTIFAEGKQNQVALLTGWNEDEGFLFGPGSKAADYVKQMNDRYGSNAPALLKLYPASSEDEAAASQRRLSRDQIFGVQNYQLANVQSKKVTGQVYVYRFARKMPADGDLAKYGAFHTAEVPYAYNNLQTVHRPFQQADHELADLMSSYWANFAKTGNPAGKGLLPWPAYDTKTNTIMVLSDKSGAQPLPDKSALDFLYGLMKATPAK
jgi:para-nitrobenzyl esterase